jgi:AcrR family transcriptional regulator
MTKATTARASSNAAASADESRRERLLDAAIATFLRFGFRKTSMEEVARAAHLSRQALYLHFPSKEKLFEEAVHHVLTTSLEAARAAASDAALPLEQRLEAAFDAWSGRYAGMAGGDVTDLEEASKLLVGERIAEYEARFVEMVTKLLRSSTLPAAYKAVGAGARELSEMLYATARGLKHHCASRADFRERIGVAVRVVCAPLRERR